MNRSGIWLTAIMAMIAFMGGLTSGADKQTKAKFADKGLELAVRMAVQKPEGDVYVEELATLPSLITNAQSIESLAGIEQCPALTYLNVGGNKIVDLTPVASLGKLDELVANQNLIVDLTSIKGMESITRLDLGVNKIEDFTPLGEMTGLTSLSISGSRVKDLTPIAGLVNLERLTISANLIEDLAPLGGMTKLKKLYAQNNKITDLAPLVRLVKDGGLGEGSLVKLAGNPLGDEAKKAQIPYLEKRGVKVKQ